MVLPLLPLIGGLAAFSSGGWAGSALAKSKKGSDVTQGGTVYHPYSHYQPVNTLQYTHNPQIQYPSYQTMIESPFGSQTTKKSIESTMNPSQAVAPQWYQPGTSISEPGSTPMEGMMPLALIAVVGVLGYGMINKKGGKK